MNDPLPTSFTDLLKLLTDGYRKRPQLAAQLKRNYWEITHWERNNRIPVEAWGAIMEVAKAKKIKGITLEFLYDLSKKSREEK